MLRLKDGEFLTFYYIDARYALGLRTNNFLPGDLAATGRISEPDRLPGFSEWLHPCHWK
jgi:hypothetical protein